MRAREATLRILSFRPSPSQPPLVRVLHEGGPTDPANLPVSPLSTASKPPPPQAAATPLPPPGALSTDTGPVTRLHGVEICAALPLNKLVVTMLCGACRAVGTVARQGTRLGKEHSQEGSR